MQQSGKDILKEKAKAEGYDSVDEYLVFCEVYDVVQKMNVALDRAFLPDELMKYCEPGDSAVIPQPAKR